MGECASSLFHCETSVFPYWVLTVGRFVMKASLCWSLLCSFILSEVGICVCLNDTLSFTNECNLTASHSISTLMETQVQCTTSVAWTGAELSETFFHDCWVALNILFSNEVRPHGVSEFEFLRAGSVPVHHNPEQRTPQRYFRGESRKGCYL